MEGEILYPKIRVDISGVKFSRFDIERKIKIPNEITQDLAYLCGILSGDGHIEKNYGGKSRNRICCGGNPKDEKKFYNITIKNLFKKLFNANVTPKDLGDGTYGIKFSSLGITIFLTKVIGLPRGKKYDTIKIPKLFLQDKKLILSFVRGLFDTDFGFCLCKKYHTEPYYPQVCFDSKSENFAKEIWNSLKLLGLGFKGKVYRVYDEDDRAKAGFTVTYRFDLYGHKNFVDVLNIIKLRQPKHIKKYKEWLKVNKNNPKVKKLLIAEISGGFPERQLSIPLDLNSSGVNKLNTFQRPYRV